MKLCKKCIKKKPEEEFKYIQRAKGKETTINSATCNTCRAKIASDKWKAKNPPKPLYPDGTKSCGRCRKVKPIEAFRDRMHPTKSERRFKGTPKHSYCEECLGSYYKTYNKKRYSTSEGLDKERARCRNRYARIVKNERWDRKRKLIEMCGGACIHCGYSKSIAALDFHHRDPTEKRRAVGHILANNGSEYWDQAIEESKKCDLVCSNCHRELTFPEA